MKKSMFVVTLILLLSLVGTSSVMADGDTELPIWEEVFADESPFPGWYEADDTALQFKGRLYIKFVGEDIVDQAWSTTDGENWSLAWDAPSIDPDFEYFWPMIVFQNQLYLVLRDEDGEYADRIVRTPNGKNWETVAIAEGDEGLAVWFGRFMTFNGQLYIYFGNWDEENNEYSEHLWRSASGDLGSWDEVAQFSCGMRAFATFRGALYIGSDWCGLGVQIWRSFDGVNWEVVTTDGFEIPSNGTVGDFGERGGYLYVGLANSEGGQIWRTRDGMHWDPVTTDGFEDPYNYMFTFATYKENLYAFSAYSPNGVQVYRSKDGESWFPANEQGWNDPANVVVYDTAMEVYKGALYVSPEGPAGILRLVDP